MSLRQLTPDEVADGYLDRSMTFIGFAAEEALFRRADGQILAITLCLCGEHLAYIEADESEVEKQDLGDA